jgi:peptidoglycan/xylan/chitin deacetylase (PgdA/CDA1 family)
MGLHQTLLDAAESWYRRRRARTDASGRPRYGRRVGWWSTKLPRAASPFFPDIVWRLPPSAATSPRRVALTFDDGPTTEGTRAILDCLDRHRVSATFFLVGERCAAHPELVREMVARGHAIGNHTWSHVDTWLHPFPVVADELTRTEECLAELTGAPPTLVRPPHGHFTAKLRAWCRERDRLLVLWDTLPADFVPWATVASLRTFLDRHTCDRSILVLHDSPDASETPRLLDNWLPAALDKGWTFTPLDIPQWTVASNAV